MAGSLLRGDDDRPDGGPHRSRAASTCRRATASSAAPAQQQAALADLLASAYASGLRDVFVACGAAGIVGGLLVLWLVRAAAPTQGPQEAPRPREAQTPAATH